MRTTNTVLMAGSLDRIVALGADTERWPELLPHYRWVTLLDGDGDHKTVEMAARRGRIPVKWRAKQDLERDGPTPVIRFRHIAGVTRGMVVAWTFAPGPDGVAVTIDHQFRPPWPVIGNAAANYIIGPHFVEAIANRTLAAFKEMVEDRDPRFDPDGRARQ